MLDRLNLPRRLSSRMWLLTLPTALVSFERQQDLPKLPLGPFRFAGVPLVAAGLALAVWGWRNPDATIHLRGPFERLPSHPGTVGGLLAIAGAGLLLRSPVLILYSLAVAAGETANVVSVDEPRPADVMGRG